MFLTKFKVMLFNDELWKIKSEHDRKKNSWSTRDKEEQAW
jgi:hypothetical protein